MLGFSGGSVGKGEKRGAEGGGVRALSAFVWHPTWFPSQQTPALPDPSQQYHTGFPVAVAGTSSNSRLDGQSENLSG
jgi:hypothetical protein